MGHSTDSHLRFVRDVLRAGIVGLALASAASAQTWSGGGTNSQWDSNSLGVYANWDPPALPGPAADVVFGTGFSSGTNIDLHGDRTVHSLTIHTITGFTLSNNTLTLAGGVLNRDDVPGVEATQTIACDMHLTTFDYWTINGSNRLVITGDLNGTGFGKAGAGTLVLTGNNTLSSVTVAQGTLIVNNVTGNGAGPIPVVNGSTVLGGNGSIGGLTHVQAQARVSPGDPIGTLTFNGGLFLDKNAVMELDLGNGGSDKIRIAGGNYHHDGKVFLRINDTGGLAPGQVYTIIDHTGATLDNVDTTDFEVACTRFSASVSSADGKTIQLTIGEPYVLPTVTGVGYDYPPFGNAADTVAGPPGYETDVQLSLADPSYAELRAIYEFDLSGRTTVTSATLEFWTSSGTGGAFEIHPYAGDGLLSDGDYTQATLTPGLPASAGLATLVQVDVTAAIAQRLANHDPFAGFVFKMVNDGTSLNIGRSDAYFCFPGPRLAFSNVPSAPTLIDAASRRKHGNAGTFDIKLPLSGTAAIEPRLNGTNPQMVLTFSGPIEATDGAVNCGAEVVVTHGTCNNASLSGNTLTVDLTFNSNSCVKVTLNGLRGAGGGLPLSGDKDVQVVSQPGNANGAGSVNILDLQAIKNQLNQPVIDDNFTLDVNCTGSINILDLQAAKNNLNQPASCP